MAKPNNKKFTFDRGYLVPVIIFCAIAAVIVMALIVGDTKSKAPSTPKPRAETACGPYRNDVSVKINGQLFKTEIAKTAGEQAKGLGGRPCIKSNQAMLFAFAKPGQYRFWMKDMKFPIDILWIGADHKVAAQEINVEPSTYHSSAPFFENDPQHLAQFVLEIQANRSPALHVNLGTPVQL